MAAYKRKKENIMSSIEVIVQIGMIIHLLEQINMIVDVGVDYILGVLRSNEVSNNF